MIWKHFHPSRLNWTLTFKGGEGILWFRADRVRQRWDKRYYGLIFNSKFTDGGAVLFHKEVWVGPFILCLHHWSEVDA